MKIYELLGLYLMHIALVLSIFLGMQKYYSIEFAHIFGDIFALMFFVLIMEFGSKSRNFFFRPSRSLGGLIKEGMRVVVNYLTIRKCTILLCWIFLGLVVGLVLRMGISGGYLLFLNIFNHDLLLKETLDFNGAHGNGGSSYQFFMVLSVVIGAIREEVVYRYYIFRYFIHKYSVAFAVLISSLVFGVVHANPLAFFAGLSFALLYLATGRLVVAIAAHVSANLSVPFLSTMLPGMSRQDGNLTSIILLVIYLVVLSLMLVLISNSSGVKLSNDTGMD